MKGHTAFQKRELETAFPPFGKSCSWKRWW